MQPKTIPATPRRKNGAKPKSAAKIMKKPMKKFFSDAPPAYARKNKSVYNKHGVEKSVRKSMGY